jgi:hypothetical protein
MQKLWVRVQEIGPAPPVTGRRCIRGDGSREDIALRGYGRVAPESLLSESLVSGYKSSKLSHYPLFCSTGDLRGCFFIKQKTRSGFWLRLALRVPAARELLYDSPGC